MVGIILLIAMVGVVILGRHLDNHTSHEELGSGLTLAGSFALISLLIAWPANYYDTKGKIQEFGAVRQTVEAARQNQSVSPVELAAIQIEIIKSNAWLASTQYWKKTVWGFAIPDEVVRLSPIK